MAQIGLIDGSGGLAAGGGSAVNKYYTPLSQKQGFLSNAWSGTGQLGGNALLDAYNSGMSGVELQSMYDSLNADGVFGSNGLSGTSAVSGNGLGSEGVDWGAAAGLAMDGINAYLGYNQNKKNYELQKKALNSNLKDAAMARDTTYNAAANQVGTQKSLTGAFGGDTSTYDDRLARLNKYASDGGVA